MSPCLYCEIVNVALTVEKKSFFSLEPLLARFLPEQAAARVLLWSFLPAFLFLLTVGVSFLNFCVFTKYIPFLALISAILTLRFRTVGLSVGYMLLFLFTLFYYSSLPREILLWQMGVVFGLSLSIYILLLSIEETEACLEESRIKLRELMALSTQTQSECSQIKKTAEEKEKEFREEIEKLKEEASLRRIDYSQLLREFELIQSEIQMLTSQKEEFIEEARKSRTLSVNSLKQLEESRTLTARYLEQLEEQQALSGSYLGQLEESRSLSANYIKQLEEKENAFKESSEQLKKALIVCQESLLQLQQAPPPQVVCPEEINNLKKEAHELKKALAQAEGRHTQLRAQFEEKSATLDKTRKDLFEIESKLLALQHDNALAVMEPFKEVSEGSIREREAEMSRLVQEVERLEKEISSLEELVSHILSQ